MMMITIITIIIIVIVVIITIIVILIIIIIIIIVILIMIISCNIIGPYLLVTTLGTMGTSGIIGTAMGVRSTLALLCSLTSFLFAFWFQVMMQKAWISMAS